MIYRDVHHSVIKKKKKKEVPFDQQFIPLLGIFSKELKAGTRTNVCTLMFTAASFSIAEQPKGPSTHEMVKCGLAVPWNTTHLKKKAVLTHATMRMSHEAITVSAISQSQQDTYCTTIRT